MAHVHAPGLVLQLDPDELLKHGARCSCSAEDAVNAQHFFVCLRADAKEGWWLPMFKGPGPGRILIADAATSGQPRFAKTPWFVQPEQVWRMSHKAAQLGAAAAYDSSTPRVPNRVAPAALPALDAVAVC